MSDEKIDNHELASFVTSTLNAIAGGVESASSDTKRFSVPTKVNFEIAVTATRSSSGGGGLKLQVFNLEGKAAKADEQVSRVSFEVATHNKNTGGRIDYGDEGNWKTR
jgi:hypothetical protein